MSESASRPTVLLVSSSANSTRLLTRQLKAYFEPLTAADGEQAWAHLQESSDISLVVSDQALVIDKFGLLERIRSAGDHWLAATPVLLLVGENDSEEGREMAFEMGATDFINLPFSASELKSRARLHANIFLQQSAESRPELAEAAPAANLLQQLSQKNFFNSRVTQELSFSLRHRTSFSLCKLRVDNLQGLYDKHGKATAAAALKAVAKVLKQALRREDCLCYPGGADFLLLLPATNGIGASTAFNRLFKKITEGKLVIAGNTIPVVLCGAVHSCIAGKDVELDSIYRQLDDGLDKARANGENQWVGSSAGGEDTAVSLDRALRQLEYGATAELAPRARAMMNNLLPLLRFGDSELNLECEALLRELEKRLQ